jgi:hypothetical protein
MQTDPSLESTGHSGLASLVVRGRDAIPFLQGQTTADARQWGPTPLPAAFLTPQGRILATVLARSDGESVRLVLPTELAEPLRAHLGRYVMRAKVIFSIDAPDAADLAAGQPGSLEAIRAGRPTVVLASREAWIPQMLNFDLIDGISFSKGCYTGQEIVARTQHLGRIKRRTFRYTTGGAAPAPLTAVMDGSEKVGEVVNAAVAGVGCELLAVVALESAGRPLALEDGRTLVPASLPYAIP